jgi:hypothetical protein
VKGIGESELDDVDRGTVVGAGGVEAVTRQTTSAWDLPLIELVGLIPYSPPVALSLLFQQAQSILEGVGSPAGASAAASVPASPR